MKVKFYLASWIQKEIYEVLDFKDLWITEWMSEEKINGICERHFADFLKDYVEGGYIYDKKTGRYIFYVEGFDERTREDYSAEDLRIEEGMSKEDILNILSSVYKDYLSQFDQGFIIDPADNFLPYKLVKSYH